MVSGRNGAVTTLQRDTGTGQPGDRDSRRQNPEKEACAKKRELGAGTYHQPSSRAKMKVPRKNRSPRR
jgi:hypothetical protein